MLFFNWWLKNLTSFFSDSTSADKAWFIFSFIKQLMMALNALSISFTYFYTFWFDWQMSSISKSKIKLGFNLPHSINSGSRLLLCLVRIIFKVIIIIDFIKWDAISIFNPYKTAKSNFRFMSLHYLLIRGQNNYRSNLFH